MSINNTKEFEGVEINESFSDDDLDMLDKFDKKEFESSDLFDLKISGEEISQENEIQKLICENIIRKNLEYKLQFQTDGALKILRDLNGTALLSDEVGLGKTITAGITLKECIMRGFVSNVLILTPPSLVNQWREELKEKFELDFKIIERGKQR